MLREKYKYGGNAGGGIGIGVSGIEGIGEDK